MSAVNYDDAYDAVWAERDRANALQAILDTIPEDELAVRRVMAEIEATGLLAKDWTLDQHIRRSYGGWADWRWNHGSGWLSVYPPDCQLNRGHDDFSVSAAFGDLGVRFVRGATATEALVNAINRLAE